MIYTIIQQMVERKQKELASELYEDYEFQTI